MGSKAKLANEIISLFPQKFNTYYEPFFGSGSVFFKLQPSVAVCSDLMSEPISLMRAIKDEPELLYKKFVKLADRLWDEGEAWYYSVREKYNNEKEIMLNVDRAAYFVFLLRAGFNGVIRFNLNNDWNVSYGKRGSKLNKNTKIYSSEFFNELKTYSDFLREGSKKFLISDFKNIIELAGKNDLIYADPPYTQTQMLSYKRYNMTWSSENDIELHDSLSRAVKRGAFFVLSNIFKYKNMKNNSLLKLYQGFKTKIIKYEYVVGPNSKARQHVEEILIYPEE